MDSVLRAAAIYLVVLVVFRLAGRRTLSELTTFDFVLLLIIGEATQQALLGDDFSIVNAMVVIVSLVVFDIALSLLKNKSRWLSKLIDGEPMIIVEHGQVLERRIRKARIDEGDILEAARHSQGLERIDQIKFAILEKDGKISIIPR
ncbi:MULTISPECIES: DUF421 domain-containing protein [Pseudomonadaceae]|uniref:DUF421 domain-containing protein n=5 Tax=Stutzerimonas TaxID=2901164 RepID=A0ABX9VBD4_9GAMM|nr:MULTISPECIES: YetF domain-containing protein [Pseudomonadaceae]AFN79733.1 hypothetical protein PSJM300_18400 [Stutzerimonas stutzeri DSM 10701]KRW67305.1 hypothetical protein AO729_06575 [Pseudomonas sp. TTU2014-066ASC]MBA1234136.1 DUF421 domain-containing protein [Stutzerimonas stutzeri]RRV22450.1 DUF421 domain-containing protein [Pseudomonas sp. s199]MBT1119989.1 DUF421 domain-containing protein [Stutzerimonas nitrititolerans]